MYSITKWIKENREAAVLLLAVVIFFFVYAGFYLVTMAGSSPKFNSPDEASNYFFIKNYVSSGSLQVFEPLNVLAEGMIHPRSMFAVDNFLVPGSFLGLILLYGWLAEIFTLGALPWFSPFFAGLAVLFFYGIFKNIFDRKIALASALLLLVHPAFWYYSSRGLFPNILFVSLLLGGFYFLIKQKDRQNGVWSRTDFILAGLFFGLAFTVRLSEIIWVGVMLLILFLFFRKKIRVSDGLLFLVFSALPFVPVFYYNWMIYGSPLATAYNLGGDASAGGTGWLASLGNFFLPFGFHPRTILENFSTYFAGMFWWLAVPSAIGLAIFLKKLIAGKLDKKIKIYLFVGGLASLFLFIYYGSWIFYDNPAREASIGTSYVRYWLPIYILSLPLVAFCLVKLLEFIRPAGRKILVIVLGLIFILFGVNLAFFDKNDGLAYVAENVKTYIAINQAISSIIEPDAVLVVDRADKIFFPEHKVITPLRDDNTYKLIPKLAQILPLYYYGLPLTEEEINYIYQNKLDQNIIQFEKIGDFGAETLYRLELK